MKLIIVADSDAQAGIGEVFDSLHDFKFRDYFLDRIYDTANRRIAIVLMCRTPDLKFKQRIRFSKKDNTLYMDIMLNFETMRKANTEDKKRVIARKLMTEVPQIIAKYKFNDFKLEEFTTDINNWFIQNNWIDY